jgi:hypothetical protein
MSLLNHFYLKNLGAYEFRDYLTQVTGKDMGPYFDAWIFNPGYPTFEIDSVKMSGSTAQLFIQQKGHHLPVFHKKVPLQAVFYDENANRIEKRIEVDGEFSTVSTDLPAGFDPKFWVLNENQWLNIGSFNAKKIYKTTTAALEQLANVDFMIKIESAPANGDSMIVSIDHHWGEADPQPDAPSYHRLSKNHFWQVKGHWPVGFRASATLNYNGNSSNSFLDADLVANGEDSLKLFYRPAAGQNWQEFPFYSKILVGGPSNGFGVIKIDTLLRGDYSFGVGELPPPVGTQNPSVTDFSWKIFPNPTTEFLQIEPVFSENLKEFIAEIYDENGRLIMSEKNNKSLKINHLNAGNYLLKIKLTSENRHFQTWFLKS